MRRRKSLAEAAAPTLKSYGGFIVGQDVTVNRKTILFNRPFVGRIARIVRQYPNHCFAVVQDTLGGSHMAEFDELT